MRRFIVSYIEKIYPGEPFRSEIAPVKERDPFKVRDNGKMIGFRFFDEPHYVRNEDHYVGNKQNYSNYVFYGTRESFADVKKNTAYELDHVLSTLVSKGYRFGTLSMTSPTVHHRIAN